MTTVATKIHIRNAEGDGVLCGADVPFMETLPARSVQPAGEPDCREWAEDRLAKSMCCPDCLERRDAPMGNAIAMIHQINTATRETLCGLTQARIPRWEGFTVQQRLVTCETCRQRNPY